MDNILVYPYDENFYPFLGMEDISVPYSVHRIVSPSGWGLTGLKVQRGDKEFIVEEDFEKSLKQCKGALIIDTQRKLSFAKNILPWIYECIKNNKKVWVTRFLNPHERKLLEELERFGVQILREDKENYITEMSNVFKIKKISIPVIIVCGESENVGKLLTQINLINELKKLEYKITWISSNCNAAFWGKLCIPQFMYDDNIPSYQKIISLNAFVKKIESVEKPEAIIMGIPGGVGKIADNMVGDFGCLAFQVAEALKPDYIIYNMSYIRDIAESRSVINNAVSRILGENVDIFNIVPKFLDIEESENTLNTNYLSLSERFLKQHIVPNENIFVNGVGKSEQTIAAAIVGGLGSDK